ncbi:MAG: hypothetical protein ACR2JJ_09265 [Sphingomicrobium sp.]
MRTIIATAIVVTAGACTDPSPQPQPDEIEVVNATRVDPGAAPGAFGNESVNYAEGNITPAERGSIHEVEDQSPERVAAQFANLIVRRRFEDAHRMWDPHAADFTVEQLAEKFERYRTIQAAIGLTATASGGGGSIEQVQLTLSGTTTDGSNYVLTGPVTLSRGGGPGELERWRIAKLVLTSNPRAADALVEPQGGQ